ncbi:hypothetical protein DB324_01975 [Limosilactobacillus reuteri]|nr:hypothetical protein DB324_01975 [Limosilactobacillus reuteri]PUH36053.1 hypothetical protein DB323_01970 [Limosilactobacillus reuteri]
MRHLTDILSYRFGSLNMIPDVTPNGVFYLPPTGWLTSFYNPPCQFMAHMSRFCQIFFPSQLIGSKN